MAFRFEVDLGAPIPAQIFRDGGDRAVLAHVGTDDECPLSYAVFVGLSPGAGCLEYFFKLIEVDADTGEEREYWDGREVGAHIEPENRALVLQVILRVTGLLIRDAQPEAFYYCTHGDNMPPPSLEKFEAVNQVFRQCGYVVSLTNSDHGRYSWWVERPSE